jgi:dTDP-4-dehydrorhamnose reductase
MTSWHGFALRLLALYNATAAPPLNCTVTGIPTSGYTTRAVRPANSLIATDKLRNVFGLTMPPWEIALAQCVDELLAIRG